MFLLKFAKMKYPLILITICTIIFLSCKKEPVKEVDVVKNKFIGRWPLKLLIIDTLKNGLPNKPDTTVFEQMDTLVFTAEGKVTRAGISTPYTFDDKTENVTYGNPSINWHINFLRINSIILSHIKTENSANGPVEIYTEEQLIK
jgi:hypothetical protein